MPFYEFSCKKCKSTKDYVYRTFSELDRAEVCSECDKPMIRLISAGHFLNEKVGDSYFSNSFGKVVKNKQHEKQIAKEQGAYEIGNEIPHKHLKPERKEYTIG